jgi:hypothetical protein
MLGLVAWNGRLAEVTNRPCPVAWWIRCFKKCDQAPEALSIAIWLDQTLHLVCIAVWVMLAKC